jgi:hypothetical protein
MQYKDEDIKSAQAMMRKYRVPASVALAQYTLESAAGRFEPRNSNNGLGIGPMAGYPSVESPTHQMVNHKLVPVVNRFAVFRNHAEMFDAWGKLVSTGAPYREAMKHTDDPEKFADGLTAFSTTDGYTDTVKARMKKDNLTQYDVKLPPAPLVTVHGEITMVGLMSSVRVLQVALNRLGADPQLDVDGLFGPLTEKAVEDFQTDRLDITTAEKEDKLEVDGIPGARTNAAILFALANGDVKRKAA